MLDSENRLKLLLEKPVERRFAAISPAPDKVRVGAVTAIEANVSVTDQRSAAFNALDVGHAAWGFDVDHEIATGRLRTPSDPTSADEQHCCQQSNTHFHRMALPRRILAPKRTRCSRCDQMKPCSRWDAVQLCAACVLLIIREWSIRHEEFGELAS